MTIPPSMTNIVDFTSVSFYRPHQDDHAPILNTKSYKCSAYQDLASKIKLFILPRSYKDIC